MKFSQDIQVLKKIYKCGGGHKIKEEKTTIRIFDKF